MRAYLALADLALKCARRTGDRGAKHEPAPSASCRSGTGSQWFELWPLISPDRLLARSWTGPFITDAQPQDRLAGDVQYARFASGKINGPRSKLETSQARLMEISVVIMRQRGGQLCRRGTDGRRCELHEEQLFSINFLAASRTPSCA